VIMRHRRRTSKPACRLFAWLVAGLELARGRAPL
jgi:hypothetical protein